MRRSGLFACSVTDSTRLRGRENRSSSSAATVSRSSCQPRGDPGLREAVVAATENQLNIDDDRSILDAPPPE